MNILVVGCGHSGSAIASTLSRIGHDVSVIDRDSENFALLDSAFEGIAVGGIPIDQAVLMRAGIESCDALVAVTGDDNVNIMVSQVAKSIFKVKKVIARVDDPRREAVFSQFGISTICPTNLTVSTVCSWLVDHEEIKNLNLGSSTVSFSSLRVPRPQAGKRLCDFGHGDDEAVFGALDKHGALIIAQMKPHYELQEGDRIVFVKLSD